MTDFYYQNRAAPLDDDYTGDLQERPTRQRPTLTRKQAAAVWREEREMMFFSLMMRESTSYSAYAIDDLMSPDSGRRRFEAWQQRIERDREQRNRSYERMMQELERDKRKSAGCGDNTPAERRTPANDD